MIGERPTSWAQRPISANPSLTRSDDRRPKSISGGVRRLEWSLARRRLEVSVPSATMPPYPRDGRLFDRSVSLRFIPCLI